MTARRPQNVQQELLLFWRGVRIGEFRETHKLRTTPSRGLVVTEKKENTKMEAGLGEKEDGFVRGRTCAHAQHLREGAKEGGG